MVSLNEQQLQHLVTEIFRRLAVHLGSDGRRGKVMTVFSGATVGLPQALDQLRWCSLQGFCQVLAFSPSAEAIYGESVRQQLTGFPNISALNPEKWIHQLAEVKALLVPMLSLNTASKVSLLIADSMPANLIIHAISLGVPVIAATNGADPDAFHWARRTGSLPVAPAFRDASRQRLQTLRDYGCLLTEVQALGQTLLQVTEKTAPAQVQAPETQTVIARPAPVQVNGRLVSTGHIREAHRHKVDILLGPETVVTPLAREMAASLGVKLQHNPR